jgi:hypothetical protein
MKKLVFILAFAIAPLFAMSQNTNEVSKEEIKSVVKTEVAIKKVDPISINPLEQNKNLNAKKSIDLISVKAYIKSLQLKRKASLMS